MFRTSVASRQVGLGTVSEFQFVGLVSNKSQTLVGDTTGSPVQGVLVLFLVQHGH